MSGDLVSGTAPLPPAVVSALQAEAARHLTAEAHSPIALAEDAIKHHHTDDEEEDTHVGDDKKDAEAQRRDAELQDEPEIVDAPLEVVVTDSASLSAELDRVSALLSPGSRCPWVVRVQSLKRISAICKGAAFESIRALPSFVSQMGRLRAPLVEQLKDRRSQVAKQACATISSLSSHFKSVYLSDPPADAPADTVKRVAAARATWMELTLYFIDALLPLIPITVQVINSSACLCLSAIVKNIAGLPQPEHEHALIDHLITTGAQHKHGIVRDHSYRAIANCIIRIEARDLAYETECDREESERIQAKLNASANGASSGDDIAPAAAPSSSSSSASAGSPLFSKLENIIASGVHDSHDKTRAASRLCLIHLRTAAPARAQRVLAGMTAAQQKVFQKQLDDFLTNKAMGNISTTSPTEAAAKRAAAHTHQLADEQEHNVSDEELEAELNPPAASSHAARKGKAHKSAAAAASVSASASAVGLKAAKKAAALKKAESASSDDEVEVLTSKVREVSTVERDTDKDTKKKKKKKSEGTAHAAEDAKAKEEDKTAEDEEEENDGEDSDADPSTALAVTATAADQQRARNFSLLSKLLDLENPMLTEKMIDFLLHDGVIDVFISFISRVEAGDGGVVVATTPEQLAQVTKFEDLGARYHNVPEEGEVVDESHPLPEWSDVPLRPRARPAADDEAEQTATRRSFHVHSILTHQRQSPSLMAVLTPKISAIVLKLMSVFHPASKGNFFHACAVLEKLVTVFPTATLTAICSPAGRTLLSLAFDHLHEPPVISCLIALIQASLEVKVGQGCSTLPTDLIHHIRTMKLLENKLVERMVAHPLHSAVAAQGATDFITQYMDKLVNQSAFKHSSSMARLFEDVASTEGGVIDRLVEAISAKPHSDSDSSSSSSSSGRPSWQVSNCALVLHTLISVSSEAHLTIAETDVNAQAMAQMLGQPVSLTKQVQNPLLHLKKPINERISRKFEELCEALTRTEETEEQEASSSSSSAIRFSAYTVPVAFTQRRIQLFRTLIRLIDNDLNDTLVEAERVNGGSSNPPSATTAAGARAIRLTAVTLCASRLFNRIPPSTWSTLIDWFFRYVDNNFFLGHFQALILSILKFSLRAGQARDAQLKVAAADHAAAPYRDLDTGLPHSTADDDVFRILLVDLRLVSRMVAFFHGADCSLAAATAAPSSAAVIASPSPDASVTTAAAAVSSSTRSFVLSLSNHFRLSMQLASHHSFLWHHLHGSQSFAAFMPTLCADARQQARNLHVKPVPEPKRNPERTALERALGFSLGDGGDGPPPNPNAFKVPEGYGEGIEIGSVFAHHLGYTEKAAVGGKKKKKKKGKKKKNAQASAAAASEENGTNASDDDDDEDANESDSSSSVSGSASSSQVTSPTSSPEKTQQRKKQ